MAGDWMKIELELPDKPEVHAIAGILNIDPLLAVGALIKVWGWFDKHTTDGNAHGVTFSLPDRISGVTGLGEAMQFVGWLEQNNKTLTMPKFDRHTSESAKTRALTAKRVNKKRNADAVTLALPEKRREEKSLVLEPKGSLSESKDSSTKRNGIPYEKIKDLYHEKMPNCPRIEILSSARKSQIGARWNSGELNTLESWGDFFEYCAQSKFLIGATDPPPGRNRFVATIDWLTKESNYVKIVEGKYHG